jgi:homoserine O-succinyltransferase
LTTSSLISIKPWRPVGGVDAMLSSPDLSDRRDGAPPEPLVIGVVNNMPDAALRTTDRQFRELLSAVAGDFVIELRIFALDVPRSEAGQAHVREHYADIRELWSSGLDGLIVTGTEPRARRLSDEPYWGSFRKLVEWAQTNTVSTIWSCLGAHAAVLCLSGIDRQSLEKKLSGIFVCERVADHPIVADMPWEWPMPHSRYNGLDEATLVAHGYQILSRAPAAGADVFLKLCNSLFVFLQGHPEYDGGALLREYRRDIARFLAGERDSYPQMPENYFDDEIALVLSEFRRQAIEDQGIDLISNFPAAAERSSTYAWREPATRLYANWLRYLAANKRYGRVQLGRSGHQPQSGDPDYRMRLNRPGLSFATHEG